MTISLRKLGEARFDFIIIEQFLNKIVIWILCTF